MSTKKEFYAWLYSVYEIDKSYAKKLNIAINSLIGGTYNSNVPIPPIPLDELMCFWKDHFDEFETINNKNPKKGERRIFYDIGILAYRYYEEKVLQKN